MSRLDPSIPLQVQPFKSPNIVQSQLQATQLADLNAQMIERRQVGALRQQQMSKIQQEQNEDNSIKQALSEAGGTIFDDNGQEKPVATKLRQINLAKADPLIESDRKRWANQHIRDTIAKATDPKADPNSPDYQDPLVKPGVRNEIFKTDPVLGNSIYDNFYKGLDASQKAVTSQLSQMRDLHGQISPMVNPASITDQASFDAAKQAVVAKLQSLGMPQMTKHFLDDLGPSFDSVETPKRLQVMQEEALDSQGQAKLREDLLAKHKEQVAEQAKWPARVAELFGAADTEPKWQAARQQAKQDGISEEYLNSIRLPGENAPTAAARIEQQGMTPEQRQTSAEKGYGTSKPFPPEVEQQKIRIANAESAARSANSPSSYQLITHPDKDGNPVQEFVPKLPGTTYDAKPTAQEQTRRDQALHIINYGDHINQLIDANPDVVGPLLGRLVKGEKILGTIPPAASTLNTALGSLIALQPILHGFRGGSQVVDHFNQVIGDQHINGPALKASIKEIQYLAKEIRSGKAKPVEDGSEGNTFDVTDPRGVVHHFPTQAQADSFKKAAGIQ